MSRSSALRIGWNDTPREAWDESHAGAAASYQQDWAYGVALIAMSPNVQVMRAAVRRADGSLAALAQIAARPFAMAGRFALCTHGPIWVGGISADDKRETCRLLKLSLPQRWPRLLVLTPDEATNEGLKELSRVMTGDATVLIDLTKDEDALRAAMDQGWRNRLSKAERSDLVVQKAGVKPQALRREKGSM